MTEYRQTGQKIAPLLSIDLVQEKKAVRRKLFEEVARRRKIIYTRWYKKRLKAAHDLGTIT